MVARYTKGSVYIKVSITIFLRNRILRFAFPRCCSRPNVGIELYTSGTTSAKRLNKKLGCFN